MPPSDLTPDQARDAMARFRADYAAARNQIARVIVGHDSVVDGVLTCLFTNGHALLEGVPGLGKTLLISSLSRALNLSFARIQFTPDLMPADISGTTIVVETDTPSGQRQRSFTFQQGPVFHQMILADEINRATPKTQSALLEAMQERAVTIAGETHPLPAPFFVMATQNPIEQEGTYPLPEAQLDRFFFKLTVPSPTRAQLNEIVARTTTDAAAEIEPVLSADKIIEYQHLVRQAALPDHVRDYAVRLTLATHPPLPSSAPSTANQSEPSLATPMVEKYARFGASPRGTQSLILAAKCRALLGDRSAAGIDDVRDAAKPALRHRVGLNFEAVADNVSTDDLIDNIITTLPATADE